MWCVWECVREYIFWSRLHLILLTTAIIITLTLNLYALNDYYVHVIVIPIYDAQFSHGVCRMLNTYIWWCIFVCYLLFCETNRMMFWNGREWVRDRIKEGGREWEKAAKMAKDKMKRENPREKWNEKHWA